MNKIKFITKFVMITMLICFSFVPSLHANGSVSSEFTEVSSNDLRARIDNLASEVDLRYTEEVHSIIDTYIKRYRRGSERLLGLSEQFFPLYEAEFSKTGIPQELKYLSIVESGLKPTAISHSGAVGLWQFMKSTGKLYGLRINDDVDERKDPIRSTQAASQYLKDLFHQFGDWTLALAAYNCGPGNVRKAIRRSQASEFWSMKNYLPRETRRYIPKYVAVSYLMNYSHVHDLYATTNNDPNTLATVVIHDYTTFTEISNLTGMSKSEIAKLNPSYKKWYIPRSSKGYYLTLPQGDLYKYLSHVGGFENLVDLGYDASKLKGRYMLYGALKRKAVEVSALVNKEFTFGEVISEKGNNPAEHPIRIGLVMTPVAPIDQDINTYKLKPQESLLDIAKKHGVKLSSLMEINAIEMSNLPPPGSVIRLE